MSADGSSRFGGLSTDGLEKRMASPRRHVDSRERADVIRLSHYRSERAGLTPDSPLREHIEDFDSNSRLVTAARPVLDRLADALDGSMAGGLLTDRGATVVDRYFGRADMRDASDALGAVLGASFSEARTGTNAVSVAVETRAPILVRSGEHYLNDLRGFSCYGVPVINPLTSRLEGVVDLMFEDSVVPGLVTCLLDRAVDEIADRLVNDFDPEVRLSMAAFRRLSRRTQDGVTLVASDFVVHNLKAADLVSGDDAEVLRDLAGRLRFEAPEPLELSSGAAVTVTASSSGASQAVLLRLSDGVRSHAPIPRGPRLHIARCTALDREIAKLAELGGPVFIVGPRGSGSSRAARLLSGEPTELVDCTICPAPRAMRAALDRVRAAAETARPSLLLEHIEHLRPAVVQVVVTALQEDPTLRIVATASPDFAERSDLEYLASAFCTWLEIPALGERTADFGLIVDQIVADIAAASEVSESSRPRVIATAVEHLKSRRWPGNVAELRAVLAATLQHRPVGDVVVADLPERYRRATAGPVNLTPIKEAERELIIQTLARTEGNKVHAARQLGISRSKLYDRIRQFGINAP